MRRTYKLGTSLIGLALLGSVLSGCSTTTSQDGDNGMMGNNNGMMGMDHGSMHSMSITDKQSFAAAMVPHHQQAVDMSEYAITNTSNPDVLAIASKITSEQGPEIAQMTPWLEGKSVDYTMMMDGMLSPMQLATLRASKDADFDKLYIQYMIKHHQGAVKMATDALAVNDSELTDFANAIIVAQTAEIQELMALQNK